MASTATPSLTVLGPFALCVEGREITGLPRKAQALLSFLALQPKRPVSREIVADLLWTRSAPEQARHSLRQMLVVLRRTPARDLIRTDGETLWIDPGSITVDAAEAEAGLVAGTRTSLSHAASLYRGPLLADLPAVSQGFDEWLLPERARLAGIMAEILHRLAAMQIAASEFDAAAATAARLVGMDGLDEAAHRLLIDCLARGGRRAEALQQFETCTRTLRTELDIAPDAETMALAVRIRNGPSPPGTRGEPLDTPDVEMPGAATTAIVDTVPPAAKIGDIASTGTEAEPAGATPARRWPRLGRSAAWASVGAILALCIAAIAVGWLAARPSPVHLPGLMVAQFRNVSGVPSEDGAAAGFADLVAIGLATHEHLRLIGDPANDAEDNSPARDRIRLAAGARYVLDGTVTFETSSLHVTARLTDVRHATELWSNRFDELVVEAAHIADEIAVHAARAVAHDNDIVVGSPVMPSLDGTRTARELVALGHQTDYFTPVANPDTQRIYRLAQQFDQDNADALAHLANAMVRSAIASIPVDQAALAHADAILQRATQLDPTNVFALFNACVLRRRQDRIAEAIELCKRVLDLNPRYPGALRELGHDLLESGDAAGAIEKYRASIDAAPYLPYVYSSFKGMGVASLALGRRDDALVYLQKSLEADVWKVDNEQLWLAAVLEIDGRHAEAAELVTQYIGLHPGLQIDEDYLGLLQAPAYAGCRKDVLAALARAGYRQ